MGKTGSKKKLKTSEDADRYTCKLDILESIRIYLKHGERIVGAKVLRAILRRERFYPKRGHTENQH